MKSVPAYIAVSSFMSDGYLLTAHSLAKMTGYTPQHINRVLRKLFNEGKVAFTVVPHQGRSGFARKWCSVKATKQHYTFQFTKPEYVQMEMTI